MDNDQSLKMLILKLLKPSLKIVYVWCTVIIFVFYFLSGSIKKKLKAVKAGIAEESTQTRGMSGGKSWNSPFAHTVNSFLHQKPFFTGSCHCTSNLNDDCCQVYVFSA